MAGIYGARWMLRFNGKRITSLRDWQRHQQAGIAALVKEGFPAQIVTVTEPLIARIEQNRWLADCPCGSGVAIEPSWPEARCMGEGCGRVFTNVVLPAEKDAIEAELVKRTHIKNRNWLPGETVDDLKAETESHVIKESR